MKTLRLVLACFAFASALTAQIERANLTGTVTDEAGGLPFGPGRKWFSKGIGSHILGRWQFSGVTTLSRSLPMIITGPNNTRLPGVGAAAVRVKNPVLASGQSTLERYFGTTAFLPAPTYSLGNDSRTQPIGEGKNIQFRAELFNVSNTPHYGAPNGNVTATNFGAITGASNSRVVQVGLRLRF